MDELNTPGTPSPCRVPVAHLTSHQLRLLRSVLGSGSVPFGIIRDEVVAPAEYADEVVKAVEWAAVDPVGADDIETDPEYRSDRAPLVAPSRPPLADGRRQATRLRRLSAGVIDQIVVGAPMVLAHRAGAPDWSLLVLHAAYFVVPTAVWGWTVGKLLAGTRVVDARLGIPAPLRALVRWLPLGVPMLVGTVTGLSPDAVGAMMMAVWSPIVVELRGLHDLLAGTRVVESTVDGPGGWAHR